MPLTHSQKAQNRLNYCYKLPLHNSNNNSYKRSNRLSFGRVLLLLLSLFLLLALLLLLLWVPVSITPPAAGEYSMSADDAAAVGAANGVSAPCSLLLVFLVSRLVFLVKIFPPTQRTTSRRQILTWLANLKTLSQVKSVFSGIDELLRNIKIK